MEISNNKMNKNHAAFMNLPVVQVLLKRIKKLEKRNKKLSKMNESLQSVIVNISTKQSHSSYTEQQYSKVNIKEEPLDTNDCDKKMTIDELQVNGDIEILDNSKTTTNKENIVYNIEEKEPPNWDYEGIKKKIGSSHPNREIIYTDDGETMLTMPLAPSAPPITRKTTVVEVEEEVEEEEEEEVEEEEEEVEEEEEEEVEEEEEEEVYETTINGINYYVTDEKNGTIYEIDENDDVGEEVGKYNNGVPVFNK
tara:strand:- start:4616 stop:5371 length:756 start_codon:yes stop_codon:yes gene_type:complete